ncbi:MAG: DUF979 domain-containing protein [Gammaproteobacteria bacterium HGW-Gammaproteobacteria-4]|nr:MAG: DUF979 domain-containing protein [Gammaproteobacteria bacterium HGW-Gammaproteobacteria-4]
MITLGAVYVLAGLMFAGVAIASLRDRANPRRWTTALFWAGLALSFLAGDRLGDLGNGLLVIVLVVIAGSGGLRAGKPATTAAEERMQRAVRHGNALFVPALVIPAVALLGTVLLKGSGWVDPQQVTLISLGLGVILALLAAVVWLRPPVAAPVQETRRLLDSIGWVAILPQMLAALGAVFALAGVGEVVGKLITDYVPLTTPFAAVAAYALGMALFTMVMGNAFAAFPVMTAAIGLPIVVQQFGGQVTVVAAIGMLSGFCGTLLTPMAANFNILPVALLELKDRNAVIKVQAPTALIMLAANIVLMYALAFR